MRSNASIRKILQYNKVTNKRTLLHTHEKFPEEKISCIHRVNRGRLVA